MSQQEMLDRDPEQKKMLIYYVYEVLKESSDEDHPLKQQEIIDLIMQRWGMSVRRKAIKSNLDALEQMGADIQTHDAGGVYLGARRFEPSEVSMLVDAVFSSREISSRYARDLAEKFYSDFSREKRKRYRYVYKAEERIRTSNRELFLTIDTINEAIERGKRITFSYISYTADGIVKNAGKVSPYYLVNNNAKYYLVCARHRAWGLSNYRVERMVDVEISEENAAPLREVKGCESGGFDIVTYANENIYMFGGTSVHARILVKNEGALAYIHEWFGDHVKIKREDIGIVAEVKANEQGLVYWVLQYGETMELLSPAAARDKVKRLIDNLVKSYS